jgi:hypothetical protein
MARVPEQPRSGEQVPQEAAADVMSLVRGLIADGIASGVLAARDPERYALLLAPWLRRPLARRVRIPQVARDHADLLKFR